MDLIQCVKDAGVVGAGGAGFPTHVKLNAKAEYIVVNGAECEPLLRVDQQLIKKYAEEILSGLEEVIKATGAKKALIAIKGKHKEAIRTIEEKIQDDRIEVFQLEDFYPAGDEQVLVYEVLKRVVPEASIPIKVGCVVLNVETVLNIYNSLSKKPVTDTFLTITGRVAKPVTVKLPIGVLVKDVLKLCGIEKTEGISVIDGGPMMGKIVENLEMPITKTTKGLVVLDEDHNLIIRKNIKPDSARRIARTACEQCRMCTDLCPRYLLGHNIQPHKMMRKVNYQYENLEDAETAFLCCECNLCELYSCPVNLPPRAINVLYKGKLAEKGIKYSPNKSVFSPKEIRDYRKVPVKRLILKLGLKAFDKDAPLQDIEYIPRKLRIPLKQHVGAAAVPVVKVGQMVQKGEVIGEIPENALGARIHTGISGKVTQIDSYITIESI